MIKRLAYRIVFRDLMKVPMFTGVYDARNGSNEFMNGIFSVMEFIAYGVSEKTCSKFDSKFFWNEIWSEKGKLESVERMIRKLKEENEK